MQFRKRIYRKYILLSVLRKCLCMFFFSRDGNERRSQKPIDFLSGFWRIFRGNFFLLVYPLLGCYTNGFLFLFLQCDSEGEDDKVSFSSFSTRCSICLKPKKTHI
jgi:hypothetical protein